ncbi:heme-binding domain-containing protein [Mangrovibacterium sp.]|uniref:heme-binding domain-containing protein n=1 Tax=Mangrovibacterium sp. TaxID=1961364 RepID=UPI0035699225
MKNPIATTALVFALLVVSNTASAGFGADDEKIAYPMPAPVKKAFVSKCFDCHNDAAKSDKAKRGFNFSTFSSLSDIQKIAALNEVKKEIIEENMPPQKLIVKHPEAALSKEESSLLIDWVKTESKALLQK